MTPYTSQVNEMVERVIELSRIYAIWWVLVEKSNFDRFARVRGNHKDFFDTTIHSLFQGFTIITYQLFDKRTDSASLSSLINSVKSTDDMLAEKLNEAIALQEPLIENVRLIRKKVYAHRDKSWSPEPLFERVGLSPSQMQEVLELAQNVVCTLAESTGLHAKAELEKKILLRAKYARKDTMLIMQMLGEQTL